MTHTTDPLKPRRWKKFRRGALLILLAGLALFIGIRYYYPYGEGVKAGQLNFVVYKGFLLKTYEGKLIQDGFWSSTNGGIQSNEFLFSIADPAIARLLMQAGGQMVDLHYKEYFGVLPWRGHSRYVVDSVIRIRPAQSPAIRPQPTQSLPTESE